MLAGLTLFVSIYLIHTRLIASTQYKSQEDEKRKPFRAALWLSAPLHEFVRRVFGFIQHTLWHLVGKGEA